MTTETYTIKIDRQKLREAFVEYTRRCDQKQNHHAVRVDADGEVYVTTEAGWSCSPDEYYGRMPHTVTVEHAAGTGQCDLPDDWDGSEDDFDERIDAAIARLEESGYEVIEG